MSAIRNPQKIHVMNRYVDALAPGRPLVNDIDCIYRNYMAGFWCFFEWKKDSERLGTHNTQQMQHEMDRAFNAGRYSDDCMYVGLFVVRLGFDYDTFPLDDTQKCNILHICGGVVEGEKTYPTHAETAIEYILRYGKLL